MTEYKHIYRDISGIYIYVWVYILCVFAYSKPKNGEANEKGKSNAA